MIWESIETAPTTGEDILVAFKGQFKYVFFIATAIGSATHHPQYAKPEIWTKIIPPQKKG